MQINTPQSLIPPTPAAIAPQVVKQYVQPSAAPTITPRPVDSGEHGQKGSSSGSATQKQGATVRSASPNRNSPRGSHLDVLV